MKRRGVDGFYNAFLFEIFLKDLAVKGLLATYTSAVGKIRGRAGVVKRAGR